MRPNTPLPRLSESAEDYLEVIGTLCQKNGQAQVSDIASILGVKKPSVTAAIRQLAELGLVDYKSYAPIKLTEQGQQYASKVMATHEMLLEFFQHHVGYTPQRSAEIACHMEHVLDDEEIAIFKRFLNNLSTQEEISTSQS